MNSDKGVWAFIPQLPEAQQPQTHIQNQPTIPYVQNQPTIPPKCTNQTNHPPPTPTIAQESVLLKCQNLLLWWLEQEPHVLSVSGIPW
jgi:hypothetical protein